ncbi:MAG: glycosyltransferase family 2 protein, partial [Anaerolineae bacterium]|nr:glycosyltransferase family 2 protein [Anaerolineae bacterium]
MTIYVGIVTYNSLPDLPACIESLRGQQTNLSITILDNASTDGTPDWVAQYAPDCRLIRSEINCGYGVGHNRILETLALAPGDFYLALNPDVVLTPTYITTLAAALQDQQADWGTGKLMLPGGDGRLYSAGHALLRSGYALNIGYGLPSDPALSQSREVFGAPGAALLLSHTLIEALTPGGNLFDPDFFLYGEDIDLDWRARHRGFRCWYEAEAAATHRGSAPAETLRVHALGNRYLAVIKNAHLLPLLTFNLPLICLHCAARLIVSPRYGWHLVTHLARLGPRMWRKRPSTMLPRRSMRRWFR